MFMIALAILHSNTPPDNATRIAPSAVSTELTIIDTSSRKAAARTSANEKNVARRNCSGPPRSGACKPQIILNALTSSPKTHDAPSSSVIAPHTRSAPAVLHNLDRLYELIAEAAGHARERVEDRSARCIGVGQQKLKNAQTTMISGKSEKIV